MYEYIVRVRVYCAYMSTLCVYEYIVRVQVHCAYTSTLCMYEYIVCTSTLCMYEYIVSACHEARTVVAMLQLAGRYLQMQEEIQMLTQKK